jgi:hypothetical protein
LAEAKLNELEVREEKVLVNRMVKAVSTCFVCEQVKSDIDQILREHPEYAEHLRNLREQKATK